MDSLSHGFAAILILSPILPAYLPAAVLGAVIPDLDILFFRFSNRAPGRYIFSHGGITHSIAGVCLLTAVATVPLLIFLEMLTGLILVQDFVMPCIVAAMIGGLTHILFDVAAYPGIPLLYPLHDRKITLGVFPGPPLPLFAVSLVFFVMILTGAPASQMLQIYSMIFIAYLALMGSVKMIAMMRISGMTIPTYHPFVWLSVVREKNCYTVSRWSLISGSSWERKYQICEGLSREEILALEALPEVRRHRYCSYIVTMSRMNSDTVLLRDPLRADGYIQYPPWFREIEVVLPAVKV